MSDTEEFGKFISVIAAITCIGLAVSHRHDSSGVVWALIAIAFVQ